MVDEIVFTPRMCGKNVLKNTFFEYLKKMQNSQQPREFPTTPYLSNGNKLVHDFRIRTPTTLDHREDREFKRQR